MSYALICGPAHSQHHGITSSASVVLNYVVLANDRLVPRSRVKQKVINYTCWVVGIKNREKRTVEEVLQLIQPLPL